LEVSFGPMVAPKFATVRPPPSKEDAVIIELRSKVATEAAKGAADRDAVGINPSRAATVLGPMEAAVARNRPQKRRRAESMADAASEQEQKLARVADMPVKAENRKPTGLSAAPLMRQALRSKDSQALHKALTSNVSDQRLIESTVMELSGAEAFDLLQECTQQLVRAPGHAAVWCKWVQALLSEHCVFIGSQPTLRQQLEPLHDALRNRGILHRSLVRLDGRLNLLLNLSKQTIADEEAECKNFREPLVEYKEGDEDAIEEESDDEYEESGEDESDSGIDADDIWDDDSSEP